MKLLALLLTILLTFGAVSCQKETPPDTSMDYKFDTDSQFYLNSSGEYYLAETSEGYYYISIEPRGFLRYIDKETLQDTLVCGKPNCLHEKSEDITQCNAYFSPYSYGRIAYYQGSLYIFTLDLDPITMARTQSIVRVSLDGFQRKKVWDMTWETEKQLPNVSNMILHRGNLYFLAFGSDTYDESPVHLYQYNLEKKKCTLLEDNLTGINDIFAVGDMLYLKAYDEETGALLHYRYQISQKELELVPESYAMRPYFSGIVCMRFYSDQHFRIDLDAKNRQELQSSFHAITEISEKYLLTQHRTIIHSKSGKEVPGKEYWDYVGKIYHQMTEKEYEAYKKREQEFEILLEENHEILNAETYEVLGEVKLPDYGFSFIQGDYLFAFDTQSETLQKIDLSKCGTEDFHWCVSQKIE